MTRHAENTRWPAGNVPHNAEPAIGDTMTSEADRLAELADGYLTTQLLRVAAQLNVADSLAAGPRSAVDLAAQVGADADMLHRILRGLAARQVLEELPGARFGLTPVGQLLRDGVPGSQRGAILARGGLYYNALAALPEAARTGRTPFEIVHGRTLFEHLAAHPDDSVAFQASMTDRSAREAATVVAAHDFSRYRTVIDVGGGLGVLLAAVLRSAPGVSGMLFDLPKVVARSSLPSTGGDFFDEVPSGADAYLMSRVIHDWDDDAAIAILRNCCRAMHHDATLLLVEAVLPERAAEGPAAIRMDLHMLTLVPGRERTAAEYRSLLAASGLRLAELVPADLTSGLHIVIAIK